MSFFQFFDYSKLYYLRLTTNLSKKNTKQNYYKTFICSFLLKNCGDIVSQQCLYFTFYNYYANLLFINFVLLFDLKRECFFTKWFRIVWSKKVSDMSLAEGNKTYVAIVSIYKYNFKIFIHAWWRMIHST